jgi:2-C-methyl-D-erythritol 4-phosphate cytidylyltransferase/2-C-methyl-D-erythritol 2,4-cyclodiphosphate synthase
VSTWAVVVAAGRGTRFGGESNKVYALLGGKTVLAHALERLEHSGVFDGMVLVHGDGELGYARASAARLSATVLYVPGGSSRTASVYNGLKALPDSADIVAVHDGARPLCPPDVIARCIDSARTRGSGVAASAVRDTIKRVDEQGVVLETPPRAELRAVKTPQCFRMPALLRHYERAIAEGWQATDDAQIAERCGEKVLLVPCSEDNLKITTPEDIRIAEALLGIRKLPRTGVGFDVHALVPGRKLILCGVAIPHETGLAGHSDADVATHALMDALLGACGMGDIGAHFPDTDPAYKDADSLELLRKVMAMLREQGHEVVNVDLIIMAQRPKLSPYRDNMRDNIAMAMRLDPAYVNIKMTTTERLGFIGREEGIAAQAVATVT